MLYLMQLVICSGVNTLSLPVMLIAMLMDGLENVMSRLACLYLPVCAEYVSQSPVITAVWLQIYWLIMEGKSWEIITNYLDHLESGAFRGLLLKKAFPVFQPTEIDCGRWRTKHHFFDTCSKEMAKNCVMKWRQHLNCQQELLSLGAVMFPGSPWPSRMIQSLWDRQLHSKYNGLGKVATSEIIQSS